MRTRIFLKISFFAVASILFFSCSNLLEKERIAFNDSSSDKNARLILSIGVGNGARTIFADDAPLEEMNYILSGSSYTGGTISIPLSYEKNTGKLIRNDGETEIFVGKGTWNFKLTASKHETALYESEIFNFDTKAGDNALYFKLSEIKTAQGYGDIDITLNFYNEIGATKIVVDLLDLEGRVYNTALQKTFNFEPILKQTTVNYKLANVTSGAYIVQFAFFDSGTSPCHIYRELVQVRPNRTSTAEREIEKFERCHFITLDNINSEDFVLAGTSMSLMFNEQEQVILPTKNDVSRKGYEFEGWYTIENGVETKRTMIPYGTTSNIMLYAKWKLLQIETISFTNALNSSGNIELKEKTLTLNLDISPDLETLLDEQKTLTWSCSDTSGKIIVNQNGLVSVESDDFRENATITVTAPGGVKAEIIIEGHINVLTQEGFRKLCKDAGTTYNTITSFVIPDGYTIIRKDMFSGCSSLTSITIPSSVILIDENAFKGCSSLKEVHYNGTIEQWCGITFVSASSNPMNYAREFYLGDSTEKLTEIVIPNTVTKIGDCQFYGFNYITKVTIPDSVTSIGKSAFESCSSLTEITISSSVASIGVSAFESCSSLTEITIPGSVASIGSYAFFCCYSLKEITILDGVTLIEGSAFNGCSSLSKITIPGSVTSIGGLSFYDCSSLNEVHYNGTIEQWCKIKFYLYSNPMSYAKKFYLGDSTEELTKIIIPNGVTSIGENAFCGFSAITEITIPDSVTSIGCRSFENCSSLNEVHFKGTIEQWCKMTFYYAFDNPMQYARKFYLGDSTEEITEIEIPNTITKIGDFQFLGFASLTKITIPNSVTSIGKWAFDSCSSLTEIAIPDSVTSIEGGAFEDCSSLTEIIIPEKVTSLFGKTFCNCSSLVSITLPSSMNSINDTAFEKCRLLTDVTISGGISSIGEYAFGGSPHLNIHFNGTIEQWCKISITVNGMYYLMIAMKNFYLGDSTEELTEIVIPSTVTKIGDYQFRWFRNITKITISDGVTTIGKGAFKSCSALKEITIPDSVTSIGGEAFYDCSSLTEITIPNGVKSIERDAFYGCSSLTNATFENPNWWTADTTSISSSDLSDPSTAATYLKSTYKSYSWERH